MLEHHINCDTVGPNGAPGVFRVSTSWISGAVRAQEMAPNSNIRSSQDQVPLQSFVDHYIKPFHFLGNTIFLSEGNSKSNEDTLLVSKGFFDIHIRHQQWS